MSKLTRNWFLLGLHACLVACLHAPSRPAPEIEASLAQTQVAEKALSVGQPEPAPLAKETNPAPSSTSSDTAPAAPADNPTPALANAAPPAAEATPAKTARKSSRVRLVIQGIEDDVQRQAVVKSMELRDFRNKNDATDAQIRRLFRRASPQILGALAPFGYYQAKVSPDLSLNGTLYRAFFQIDLGPRTVLESVDYQMRGAAELDRTVSRAWTKFGLKAGDFLDHARYEQAKAEVQRALLSRGYLESDLVENVVEVVKQSAKAKVRLIWESKERFAMGETTFGGAQFSDEFLRRYLSYEPGDLYTQSRLLQMQQRLVEADYFSAVEISPETEESVDGRVPISVTLAPAKRSIYSYGLSYGTDSGVGVRGGLERRWVNQRGHKLRSAIEVSERFKGLAVSYDLPQPDRNRTNYGINLSYREEETDTFTSQVSKLGFARTREWKGWQQSYALQYLTGDFIVGGLRGNSSLFYPEVIFYRRKADDLVYPSEGFSLTLAGRAGAEALLSDTSFASLNADAKYITSPSENDRILARAHLGALWTDDFDLLPPELRYFAGGDRNLRGYRYQTLGPLNDDRLVRGGKYLAVVSGEYERKLSESWSLAGFVDVGNAFDSNSEIKTGAGFGLRWRSPVGLVRLDVAYALDEPGKPARLHLIIGPDL